MRKLYIVLLALMLVLVSGACSSASETAEQFSSKTPISSEGIEKLEETVRVQIEDFEITTDTVDDKPVFWVTNNSEYTITGPKLKLINMDTDEVLVAYEWQSTIKPGETSTVVVFQSESGTDANIDEVESATWSTFEANYRNDDGSVHAWFEYNYITGAIRGFNY